jgi:hypothetical protein
MDRLLDYIYGFGSFVGSLIITLFAVVVIAVILFIVYVFVILSYIFVPVAVVVVVVILLGGVIYKTIRGK